LLCIVSQKTLRTDGRRSQTCTPTLVIKPIFNKITRGVALGTYRIIAAKEDAIFHHGQSQAKE
jgi:hypothetical protein